MTKTRLRYSYLNYKEQIVALASKIGFKIKSYCPDAQAPHLETILIYNPALETSSNAIIHISATHGVEGAAGAEVQLHLLQEKGSSLLQSSQGFLMIFALNPFGFYYLRRTSTENIDLNRNTGDGVQGVSHLSKHHWLKPLWRSTSVIDPLQGLLQAIPISIINGFFPTARTIAEGQSVEPQGLFYTGSQMAIEIQALKKEICPLLKNASSIAVLDVHTGLGSLYNEMLFHCSRETTALNNYFSHPTEVPGEKKDTYRGFGLLSDRFEVLFPNSKLQYYVQELGIKSSYHSFFTMLLENNYHWSHFKKVSDSLYLKHPVKDLMFNTFFSIDPKWIQWLRQTGLNRFMELYHFYQESK